MKNKISLVELSTNGKGVKRCRREELLGKTQQGRMSNASVDLRKEWEERFVDILFID